MGKFRPENLSEAEAEDILLYALNCLLEIVEGQPGMPYGQVLDKAIDDMLETIAYPKECVKLAAALALLQLIAEGHVVLRDRHVFPAVEGKKG